MLHWITHAISFLSKQETEDLDRVWAEFEANSAAYEICTLRFPQQLQIEQVLGLLPGEEPLELIFHTIKSRSSIWLLNKGHQRSCIVFLNLPFL